jgi:sialate O-acetylesterase
MKHIGSTSFRSSKVRFSLAASLFFCLAAATTAMADVHLVPLFSDGAVLQRGMPVPVWGTADAGEMVTIRLDGKQAKATADASGHWALTLPVLTAGGPFDLTVAGKNTLILHDVLVGEVWIASGQSNMEFPLQTFASSDPVYGPKAREAIASIHDPLLRMFTVVKKVSPDGPLGNEKGPTGSWKSALPENAAKFSAVGYHYGNELRRKLNVPVGIIHTSWGGTPAEAWTSQSVLAANPKLKELFDQWDQRLAAYPADQKIYDEQTLPTWQRSEKRRPRVWKSRQNLALRRAR